MPQAFKNDDVNDFAVNLQQLADNNVTPTLSLHSLANNFPSIFLYWSENFLKVNYDKTQYLHMSKSQISDPLQMDKDILIEPVDGIIG